MRAVIQRVKHAKVMVGERNVGEIGPGFFVLLGVGKNDDQERADKLADKVVKLRVMDDGTGKMGLSLAEVGGEMLLVSQFTLYANTQKGNRPSFLPAADPEKGEELYNYFVKQVRSRGITVATGQFGAVMQIHAIADGPVTILLET